MSEKQPQGITRRRALAAGLAAAGVAAVGATGAAAQPKSKKLAGKRVLVCIGDFSEGLETYYMIYRLMEEGVRPVVAAPTVKRLQLVVHDVDPAYSNYIETKGYCIQVDVAYKDVKPADYAGLLIPGGRGPEEMRQNADALKLVRYFLDKDLPLGAMCHGPQVVYAAGPVKGRKIAANNGIRPDLELAGAVFVDKPVVADRNLITSRGWTDLPFFMPVFLEALAGT